QQIADFRNFVEVQGPQLEIYKNQLAQLKALFAEFRSLSDIKEAFDTLMMLRDDLVDAELKVDDFKHWVKKAEDDIGRKLKMLKVEDDEDDNA
ncbi:hypothetical protein Tco_1267620, partial [Tanacetum coccineum]